MDLITQQANAGVILETQWSSLCMSCHQLQGQGSLEAPGQRWVPPSTVLTVQTRSWAARRLQH